MLFAEMPPPSKEEIVRRVVADLTEWLDRRTRDSRSRNLNADRDWRLQAAKDYLEKALETM